MSAHCPERDEALLMLVHGELRGLTRWRTVLHLASCSACRARRDRLAALTGGLAREFWNPRLGARTFGGSLRTGWTSVGLVVVLFAIFGLLVSHDVAQARGSFGPPLPKGAASMPALSCHSELKPLPAHRN